MEKPLILGLYLSLFVCLSALWLIPSRCQRGWHTTQAASVFMPGHDAFEPNPSLKVAFPSSEEIQKTHNQFIRGGNPFFICTAPKTGCTAWHNFFLYVNFGVLLDAERAQRDPGYIWRTYGKFLQSTTTSGNQSLVNLYEKYDRVIIARNPYIRFVSSYQDWQARNDRWDVSFKHFLAMYKKRSFAQLHPRTQILWDHVDPITTFCNFEKVGYSSVLRLEEEALWFNWFVDYYGMTHSMESFRASGNLVFSSSIDSSARAAHYVPYIIGKQPWPGKLYNSSHHRDSVSKSVKLYTREITREVTKLFLGDLMHFGYPTWDGEPATFRFV